MPDWSDIVVETLETNGAVVYAKSNTPEFGAGGNTFNDVFGVTRNPHDLRLTAGGSSGGAAAALASGMAWLAQGSDLAGSLRTPASFCGVTSLRPSPGRIASGPSAAPFLVHSQKGPMARDVADLALFADAMVGESPFAGLAKPPPEKSFRRAAASPQRPARVAFTTDFEVTELETETEVADICARAALRLERDRRRPRDHPIGHRGRRRTASGRSVSVTPLGGDVRARGPILPGGCLASGSADIMAGPRKDRPWRP